MKAGGYFTYLVAWDEMRVAKAGITEGYRWRGFVLRGARLVALYQVRTVTEMYDLEMHLDADLDYNGVPAFSTAAEAVPFLGGRGGGYKECYRLPDDRFEHVLGFMREHVPEFASEHVPEYRGQQYSDANLSMATYRRNVLTKTLSTPEEVSCVKQRAREIGDSADVGELSTIARCAAIA